MMKNIIVYLAIMSNEGIMAKELNGKWILPNFQYSFSTELSSEKQLLEKLEAKIGIAISPNDLKVTFRDKDSIFYVLLLYKKLTIRTCDPFVHLSILFDQNWDEASRLAVESIKKYPNLRELFSFLQENGKIHCYSQQTLSFIDECMADPISIKQFESPDILYETEKYIIGIEEFQINASRQSRKGYCGVEKIREMEREVRTKSIQEQGLHTTSRHIDYSVENLFNNFKNELEEHHQKFNRYIDNMARESKRDTKFGYMVTDTTYLGSYSKKIDHGLFIFNIAQFWDVFDKYTNIDFFIFKSDSDPNGSKLLITRSDRKYLQKKKMIFDISDIQAYFFQNPNIIATSYFIPFDSTEPKKP